MVDPFVLAGDIAQTTATYATPPLLWLFLYLFAWERPDAARASGFGRTAFWLLLPGSLLGSIANAPILVWSGDVLAVNVGGGLVPILLSVILLRRVFGPSANRTLTLFLGAFAVECAALFALVLAVPGSFADPVGVLLLAVGATVAFSLALAGIYGRRALAGSSAAAPTARPDDPGLAARRALALFVLTSAVLVFTFHTTESLPGFGIASVLPWYLFAPAGAGLVAAAFARRLFDLPRITGLSTAYAASTLGVLVGADVLREPPLYTGGSLLLAIGGAGLVDLLYLSGLLAAVAAFVAYAVLGGGPAASAGPPVGVPSPVDAASAGSRDLAPSGWLRFSLRQLGRDDRAGSIDASARAVRAALARARRVRGLPPESSPRGWEGLPVPPWAPADHANLEALRSRPHPPERRDAERALVSGRLLVRLARDSSGDVFAPAPSRMSAFAVDLAIFTAPAAALWIALALWSPGSSLDILGGLPFSTSAVAYPAYAFLAFLCLDLRGGTPGKRWRGLAVLDRSLRPPSLLRGLVREAPKLLPLSVIAYAMAPALVLLIRAGAPVGYAAPGALGSVLTGGALLLIAAGALALLAAVSAIAIAGNAERQRLGDYLAGTWVVRRPRPTPVPPPSPTAPGSPALAPSPASPAASPSE
jgi:uncharacterized membrane protein/uncharacterized RDD family membrane protein YckC